MPAWIRDVLHEQVIPKTVEFTSRLHSGIVLSIDREHFRRAIVNVITNALQAIEEEVVSEKKLDVETYTANSRVELPLVRPMICI